MMLNYSMWVTLSATKKNLVGILKVGGLSMIFFLFFTTMSFRSQEMAIPLWAMGGVNIFSRVAQDATLCVLSQKQSSSRVHVAFRTLPDPGPFSLQHDTPISSSLLYPSNRTNPWAPQPGLLFGSSAEQSPLTVADEHERTSSGAPRFCHPAWRHNTVWVVMRAAGMRQGQNMLCRVFGDVPPRELWSWCLPRFLLYSPDAPKLEAVPGNENTCLRGHGDAGALLMSFGPPPCAAHHCPRTITRHWFQATSPSLTHSIDWFLLCRIRAVRSLQATRPLDQEGTASWPRQVDFVASETSRA